MAQSTDLRAALIQVVRAWESLPGGRWHRWQTIQGWLEADMKPAIDAARQALGVKVPTSTEDYLPPDFK